MANRHDEFLERGGRIFPISADTAPMNAAVVEKLALPFPILSDPERTEAIAPLGFADADDPRKIAETGLVVITPDGEIAFSRHGTDFADRPDEDDLLRELGDLGLPPTSQDAPVLGDLEPGPKAMPYDALTDYLRGSKFAALALRRRHRELGKEFADDTKRHIQMVERYLDALPGVEARKT